MRKYLHINLDDRTIEAEEMEGEALARAGRHYIVKTLLEKVWPRLTRCRRKIR